MAGRRIIKIFKIVFWKWESVSVKYLGFLQVKLATERNSRQALSDFHAHLHALQFIWYTVYRKLCERKGFPLHNSTEKEQGYRHRSFVSFTFKRIALWGSLEKVYYRGCI